MTVRDEFDLRIADLIDELAAAGAPDYLDEVSAEARRQRQRPAWRFPGRWFPMDLAVPPRAVAAFRPAWFVLAVVLLATVAVVAIVGSRPRIPPPFGPAANGVVVYDDGAHILVLDPLSRAARPLTSGRAIDTRPSFSLDGRRIAFFRQENGRRAIVVADPDGSNAREVLSTREVRNAVIAAEPPAWSPDGRHVAVTLVLLDPVEHPEIWIIDVDDGRRQVLLPGDLHGVQGPAWSPDGKRIAFLGEPAPRPEGMLYVADVDGSNLVRISTRRSNGEAGYFGFPRWAPDGTRIAVQYGDSGRLDRDILVLATGSLEETVLAGTDADEAQPAWSPDGRQLAFWREVGNERKWQVVIADLDSGTELTLAHASPTADSIGWAPDGSQLIVSSCPTAERCQLLLLSVTQADREPVTIADVPGSSYDISNDRVYWSWQRRAP